jgi:nitrate reductase alpha subunit
MSKSTDPLCQPSLPVTKKWRAPPISCVAFFYSEDTEQVYHVFDTDNLHHSLATKSRYQSAALRQDATVRVGWIPCDNVDDREKLKNSLRRSFQLPDPVPL